MFPKLPDKPDHPALEKEVLAWWEAEGIFRKVRQQNAGGPIFNAPVLELHDEGWQRVIDLNLTSVFRFCRLVGRGAAANATRVGRGCPLARA